MSASAPSVFALPDHRRAKADPTLISDDERHFAAIARCLDHRIADLTTRLEARRRDPAGFGAQTLERDADIRRLTAELTTLRRFGMDLCIGHVVVEGQADPVYVGRIGLTDTEARPLLVDWRTPAAEPFFAATLADPMGVKYRRRYRWSGGRIVDFWDELLDDEVRSHNALDREAPKHRVRNHRALDDQSAFLASLGGARTGRMQDVLGTIQADQDTIIRADARDTLVVDGGPGTGKTVVALHRAAYLLHADSRIGRHRGNLLLVGPHRPYLEYVADVLPALGEHSVQTATIADLAGAGEDVPTERDPEVSRLKSGLDMVEAIEAAVAFYEEPPEGSMVVQTEWVDVRLTRADWAEAFTSVEEGVPHNEARPQIWETLMDILMEKAGNAEVPEKALRAELSATTDLRRALKRAWPMLRAEDLVGDLWTVPAYLRLCAPHLGTEDRRLLHRDDPTAWTTADLPLVEAARARLGDADRSRNALRRRAERAAESERRQRTIEDAISADPDGEGVVTMLRHPDLQQALLDSPADHADGSDSSQLIGPFAHIIVDEAQELTDAQWRMILRRCPSTSLTVVGDRAQSRRAFEESWPERLARVGVPAERIERVQLSINYRTPSEVMAVATPEITAVRPGANVPRSVRSSGVGVEYGGVADLRRVIEAWLARTSDGVACVIGIASVIGALAFPESERVRSLTPESAKGLEFDLVVLVAPESFGTGVTGAVDRYVAMTRATRQLVVLRADG